MNRFGRFQGESNRETKNIIKEDRGAISRILTWFTGLGSVAGLTHLSNTIAVGKWGSVLVGFSNAGLVFLGADAVASVEEIAVNKHIYNKKVAAVKKHIKSNQGRNISLFADKGNEQKVALLTLQSETKNKHAFKDKYAGILKQVFFDFKNDERYNNIRNVLEEKGLNKNDIYNISDSVNHTGKIDNDILDVMFNLKPAVAKVLEIVACDDFGKRIIDEYNNNISKFNSRSHLQGSLTLNENQQKSLAKNGKIKLTDEQSFVFNTINKGKPFANAFGVAKNNFIKKLKTINNNIKEDNLQDAIVLQNELLDLMKTNYKQLPNVEQLVANSALKFNKEIQKSAKNTSEFAVANWKRHILPLTKKLGVLAKIVANSVSGRAIYGGEIKAHKLIKQQEKNTNLKFSDVFCENGNGYRKLRAQYKKSHFNDFIYVYNKNAKDNEKIPNCFACGHLSCASKHFNKTVNSTIKKIKDIQKNAEIFKGKNEENYPVSVFLDDPVVIKVNGNNFEGANNKLPLATFNIDQKQVLETVIIGIANDIACGNLSINDINNIELISGTRKKVFFIPQIMQMVDKIKNVKDFKNCALFRATQNISYEEKFKRVFATYVEKTANVSETEVLQLTGNSETVDERNARNGVIILQGRVENEQVETEEVVNEQVETEIEEVVNEQVETEIEEDKLISVENLMKKIEKIEKMQEKKLNLQIEIINQKTKNQQVRTKLSREIKKFESTKDKVLKKIDEVNDTINGNIQKLNVLIAEAEKDKTFNFTEEKIVEFNNIVKTSKKLIKKTYETKITPIVKDPLNRKFISKEIEK